MSKRIKKIHSNLLLLGISTHPTAHGHTGKSRKSSLFFKPPPPKLYIYYYFTLFI
ncbi:hypothetical protein EXN66_Car020797 [Channa argus]|uniref:Uncharacterized protein n=1 Tax=Channa argus TaxID=215402 RepID=A0A6G1QSQ2_CHAAH|nr:hypothetical protein EXN66_Car020797 [Channa argus]